MRANHTCYFRSVSQVGAEPPGTHRVIQEAEILCDEAAATVLADIAEMLAWHCRQEGSQVTLATLTEQLIYELLRNGATPATIRAALEFAEADLPE